MKHENLPTIPLLDIHQSAYLEMHGHKPLLSKEGTRIIFQFLNSPDVMTTIQHYNKIKRLESWTMFPTFND